MANRARPITYTIEDTSGGPLRHVSGVNDVTPSFRDGHILTAGRDCKLLEWQLPTSLGRGSQPEPEVVAKATSTFCVHGDWVNRVLPIPNVGFCSAGADNAIHICSVRERADQPGAYELNDVDNFYHHSGSVRALGWLGDSRDRFVACSADGTISTQAFNDTRYQHATAKAMPTAVVGSTPSCCYVGCVNGIVQRVDIRTRVHIDDFIEDAHSSVIRDMLFFETSNKIVTAGSDGLVRVWDTRHVMEPVVSIDAHGDAVWRLQRVGHGGLDTPPLPPGCADAACWSGDCCFVSGGREGTLHVHDFKHHMTAKLAQVPFPIYSFHCSGGTAVVGTCSSELLAFNIEARMSDGEASAMASARRQGSASGFHTPARPPRPSSANLAPTATAGGGAADNSLTPSGVHVDVGGAAGGGGAAAAVGTDHPDSFGQLGAYMEVEGGEELVCSPFKPQKLPVRDHVKWASMIPNIDSALPRPAALPAPAAELRGGVGFLKSVLFPTRLHSAVSRTDGQVIVVDHINCQEVTQLRAGVPIEAAEALLEQQQPVTSSWCSVSCNWGALTVTLTDNDGMRSELNEFELSSFSASYVSRLVDFMNSPAFTGGRAAEAGGGAAATGGGGGGTPTVLPPPTSAHIQENLSIVTTPIGELADQRLMRNLALWAMKRIVHAARAGRITRFLVRNLPCHLTEDDRRAMQELPVDELSALPLSDEEVRASLPPAPPRGDGAAADGGRAAAPPAPVRYAPRWVILHAVHDDIIQPPAPGAPPHNVPNQACTCDPLTTDPLPFGQRLDEVFGGKKKPLQLPRNTTIADICSYVVRQLKLEPPSVVEAQEARVRLDWQPINHVSMHYMPPPPPPVEGEEPAPPATGPRRAAPEEWIVVMTSSGIVLDPALTVGVAASMFRTRGEPAFAMKYVALL